MSVTSEICEETEMLSYAQIIDSISFEYVNELFDAAFGEGKTTLSVVYPLENKN